MTKLYILAIFFLLSASLTAQNIRGSSASSVAESSLAILDNISIYPNPVYDVVKVSVKSTENSTLTINFYNNIGKLRFTQVSEIEPGVNIITMDLKSKNIMSGVYFVELNSNNERITRKLIVK